MHSDKAHLAMALKLLETSPEGEGWVEPPDNIAAGATIMADENLCEYAHRTLNMNINWTVPL